MRSPKYKTNKLLLLLCLAVSLGIGFEVTQSSDIPSQISEVSTIHLPDFFAFDFFAFNDAGRTNASSSAASSAASGQGLSVSSGGQASSDALSDGTSSSAFSDRLSELFPTYDETTPAASPAKNTTTPSPNAGTGEWVYLSNNWYYVTPDGNYKGWLYDTDGHVYYFDPTDTAMVIGWRNIDGKLYYFDLDGIMQTGDTVIDGISFHLEADGSLSGYDGSQSQALSDGAELSDGGGSADPASPDGSTALPVAWNTEAGLSGIAPGGVSSQNTSSIANSIIADPIEAAGVSSAASANLSATPAASRPQSQKADSQRPEIFPIPDKMIALTFDDGPSSFTMRLLDCLEKYGAKATFFMVGTEIENFPDEVRRMEALGCELGNHSYKHEDLTTRSSSQIINSIDAVNSLLTDLTGHGADLVRPPYGNINSEVRISVPYPLILWSVDTMDWDTLDPDKTEEAVFSLVQDGDMILMHDIYSSSVDAAEMLIPELKRQGYALVTVSELAAAKGVELTPGISYGSFRAEDLI